MAIVRINGANKGICDYLRYGKKQGRNLSRNELDLRVALDGNLELTEQIIDSIKDADQDRYLHITISFRESEIPIETLEDITRDYKELLMHAYRPEEYNFYAEAHLPKIKHLVDLRSGSKVERKPHIHIVIPKRNLLTDTVLEPTGFVEKNKKYLDAIQEHINEKYKLESPKEFRREVGINEREIVLERVNPKEFRGSNKELKISIANSMIEKDIRSKEELGEYLRERFYEVIVRNSGTSREYFAVKNSGDKKYTNLNGAIFDGLFIEFRLNTMHSGKYLMFPNEIDKLVGEWKTRVSKEIKYIWPASSKLREKYKTASPAGKQELIKYREERFYEDFRSRTNRRQAAIKQRATHSQGRHITSTTFGVSEMHICDMVPNIAGYEYRDEGAGADTRSKTEQSEHLLREVPTINMANWEHEEHQHHGLRRSTRDNERGGTILEVSAANYEGNERNDQRQSGNQDKINNTDNTTSSVVGSIQDAATNAYEQRRDEEKKEFKEIKLKLSGDMLLKSLEATHGLDITCYSTFKAKDGSCRISDGEQNLNVSDFLTKKMHFTWNETKDYLRDCFDARENNFNFEDPKKYFGDRQVLREYFNEIRQERGAVREECKLARQESWNQYKEDRAKIFESKLSYKEKQAELSIVIFRRLQREERIREFQSSKREILTTKEQLSHWEIFDLLKKSHGIEVKEEPKIATIAEVEATQNTKDAITQEAVTQSKTPTTTQETPKEELSKQEASIPVTRKPVIEQIRLSEECSISGAADEHQDMAYFNKKRAQEHEFIKKERSRLTLNDLLLCKNERGFTEYATAKGNLIFTDRLSRIEFSMMGDKEKMILGLELACAKFNNRLQIKGLEIFKDKVLEVAAERNMNIVFVPRSLQERFEALKRGEAPTQNYITGDETQQQKQTTMSQDVSRPLSQNSNSKPQEKEQTKQIPLIDFDR